MVDNYDLKKYIEFAKDLRDNAKCCNEESAKDPRFKEIFDHFLCVVGHYIDSEDFDKLEMGFDTKIPDRKSCHINGFKEDNDLKKVVTKLTSEAMLYKEIKDPSKAAGKNEFDQYSILDYRIIDYLNRKSDKTIEDHFKEYFYASPDIRLKVPKTLFLDLNLLYGEK